MKSIRISIREPARSMYNGKVTLSAEKTGLLIEVWEFLELVRAGETVVPIPPGAPAVCVKVRLPSGKLVLLTMGRPKRGAPDADADLFLAKIAWPDQVN